MSTIADYKIEDDLYHFQINQSLDCEVLCFCTNSYNMLTRCTHVQMMWCFRFWHLVIFRRLPAFRRILHTKWGSCICPKRWYPPVRLHVRTRVPHYECSLLWKSHILYISTYIRCFSYLLLLLCMWCSYCQTDSTTRGILKFSKLTGKCG